MTIQRNWQELIKPTKLEIVSGSDNARVASVVAEPLERGYGLTLGNALRRVLLEGWTLAQVLPDLEMLLLFDAVLGMTGVAAFTVADLIAAIGCIPFFTISANSWPLSPCFDTPLSVP